jgi:hypothetical protein
MSEEKKDELTIEGLNLPEEKEEEKEEEEKSFYDLVDMEQAVEISKFIQGQFEDDLVYNIPRKNDYGGQVDWGILCDKMPGGCPYRDKHIPHVHTLGINILGANKARQLYGKLEIKLDKPEIVKVEDKTFWMVGGYITDGHNDNTQNYFYHEPVMKKTSKGGQYFNEFGCLSCQTKVTRKLILDVIPGNLKSQWIKDYTENKPYTKVGNLVDASEEPEKPKQNAGSPELPKGEQKDDLLAGQATQQQKDLINKLASKKGISQEQLLVYCKDIADVDTWADMTSQQAGRIISEIQK